ncbi:MAG TPA: zinc-ribbon domain-containing protein [Patescibacteria group bacterium]|nr:zinc-ribbon domain-containing protein [Patescibacteria group bacterium]
MIYCPECGAENADDASFCIKCGATLKEGTPRVHIRREYNEKSEKQEKDEKGEKDERLEKVEERRNWGLLLGTLIVLSGAISLMDEWGIYLWDDLWPILIIAVGLFIVWSGLQARNRSPRPS